MLSSIKQVSRVWEKLVIGVIIITLGVFFAPVFKGKVPLPADALVGLYHPYRDFFAPEYPLGIPYKNFLITDPIRQQFVWKKLAVGELKQGRIPWWNPYTFSGTPLLATMQAGVFYPLNVVFWLPNFITAWTLFIVIQPLLGAIFFYWFLRSHQIHPLASAFGSLSFIFSGFFVVWLEWGNIGHIILWLPLLFLSIDKIVSRGKWWWHAVFVMALVSQFFAGHLQISFYVIAITLAYTFYKVWHLPLESRKRMTKFFIFHFSFFILATAIQWLPTAQFISLSNRDADQQNLLTRPDWFLPWQNLAQLVAPDFFGNPSTLNYWGVWNYAEFVGYVGLVPLLFALYAILKPSKGLGFFAALVALGALALALPTPIAKLPFIFNLPLLSQAQPSRLLAIIIFCLSILASLGLDTFIKTKTDQRLWISVAAVGVTITLLWVISFGFIATPSLDPQSIAQRNLILPSVIFGAALSLIAARQFLPQLSLLRKSVVLALLLVIITAFDLYRFATKFTPFSPQEYIYPTTKTLAFLKDDSDIFRLMTTDRRLLPPNVTLAYNLQTIEGYDPLYLKTYAQLITAAEAGKPQATPHSFNRIITPGNIDSGVINQLNVKYILALNDIQNENLALVFQEGETRIYENKEVQPRARLVEGKGQVDIQSYTPNKVVIQTDITSNEAILELADMMYPGWRSTIDSTTEVTPRSSEEGFRHVTVPQGSHTVTFYYSPITMLK
ncbi:MAG: YfhO family protein [Candidatus Chisholmbacteria bacterium]|nr:YfhO family protein [Candidatus Chisholmbacteria bacterium]